MQTLVTFFNEVGWLANLIGIATFVGGGVAFFFRFVQPRIAAARIDKMVPADLAQKWGESMSKAIAKIAIVDDQPADFPVAELKANGYQVQTYKQVTLATTAQLAAYDIVFLDMKGIVKDDPENGGLKLIGELRRLNPSQKVCAVSSKTFDINATEFFRQADDAKKKPLTAHECRAVINQFLAELFDPQVIMASGTQAQQQLPRARRAELVGLMTKFKKQEVSLEQFREGTAKIVADASLAYRMVNLARVAAHAS
jgi:CheY-like chemotaxis protein